MPPVHYSPLATLAGGMVIACAATHWHLISEDPAKVTCPPCQDPAARALADARAARNKTSVNNPLNPRGGALLGLAARGARPCHRAGSRGTRPGLPRGTCHQPTAGHLAVRPRTGTERPRGRNTCRRGGGALARDGRGS